MRCLELRFELDCRATIAPSFLNIKFNLCVECRCRYFRFFAGCLACYQVAAFARSAMLLPMLHLFLAFLASGPEVKGPVSGSRMTFWKRLRPGALVRELHLLNLQHLIYTAAIGSFSLQVEESGSHQQLSSFRFSGSDFDLVRFCPVVGQGIQPAWLRRLLHGQQHLRLSARQPW